LPEVNIVVVNREWGSSGILLVREGVPRWAGGACFGGPLGVGKDSGVLFIGGAESFWLLSGLGLCDRKLGPAVFAVDGVCWVAGFAAGAESFQGLWSWYGEGLVRAGVQVELVSALALVAGDVVGFEFPFPLGRCLYCAAAPWTVQSH